MPRGVYERKSAQKKSAGTRGAKAKAKVAKRAGGSSRVEAKPAAAASLPAVLTTPAAQLGPEQPAPQFSRDDFRKPIDDMDGPLLKAYARRIGIKQRDVDGLTPDRLRQNCKVMALQALED